MEREYLISMNKIFLILIAITITIISCADNQRSTNEDKRINAVSGISDIKIDDPEIKTKTLSVQVERDLFVPDTTINSLLFLHNYQSLDNFFNASNTLSFIDSIRISPVVLFKNSTNTEYLLAFQYEGNTRYSFSYFEIGLIRDENGISEYISHMTNHDSFRTESGIGIGFPLDEVLGTKGRNFNLIVGQDTVIEYKIANYNRSSFLQRYKMPDYTLKAVIENNTVKKISLGFGYP